MTTSIDTDSEATVARPLHDAYLAAELAYRTAEATWCDDENAAPDDHAHPLWIAMDSAESARDTARKVWLDSDEPREFDLIEEGFRYATILAPSLADALEEARNSVDLYSYGDDARRSTMIIHVAAQCVETDESDSDTVEIPPIEPECDDGHEHVWLAPYSVLGGLKENPGVWGKGGGVICKEVCRHCGTYRITDTWATDRSNGTQGHTEVSYEDSDCESRAWVERRNAKQEQEQPSQ